MMNKIMTLMLLTASFAYAGELQIPLDNNPIFMDKILNKCNAMWAGGSSNLNRAQFLQQCKTREYAILLNSMTLLPTSSIQQYELSKGDPVSAGSVRTVIKNCTSQNEVHNRVVKIELADSLRATTSNAVKVTYGSSLSVSVTSEDSVLTAKANKELSTTVNLSKSQTSKSEHKRVETEEISEVVPAHTALIIEFRNARADTMMKFSGTYWLMANYNGTVVDRVSSYALSGTAVYQNTWLSSEKDYFEEELPQDPIACQNYQISGARVL